MSDQDNQLPSDLDSLLATIVNNEGQPKYSSAEDALKGAAHAQTHIGTLEQENAKLKEEHQKMQDLLANLNQPKEAPVATTTAPESLADKAAYDVDSLFEQFSQRITAKQEAERKEANKRSALQSVVNAYGDKSGEVLESRAKDLGVSKDFLLDLAANSPKAFDSLVALYSKPKGTPSFTTSTVNTTAMPSNGEQQKLTNPLLTGKTKDALALWNSL